MVKPFPPSTHPGRPVAIFTKRTHFLLHIRPAAFPTDKFVSNLMPNALAFSPFTL